MALPRSTVRGLTDPLPESLTQNAANRIGLSNSARPAQPCAGHPRLAALKSRNVDGRDKPSHDEKASHYWKTPLDDVEIGDVQLRLQDPCDRDRVGGIEGDDGIAVAVILCGVQGRLRVRE